MTTKHDHEAAARHQARMGKNPGVRKLRADSARPLQQTRTAERLCVVAP